MSWVNQRKECTAQYWMEHLAREGRESMNARWEQVMDLSYDARPERYPELKPDGPTVFSITYDNSTVRFEATDIRTIRVHHDGEELFDVAVELVGPEHRCAMTIGGKEHEVGQVLYRALDRLFF